MKIDLHLHSYASKLNGDSIKWESIEDSVTRIYNSGVRLAAFTDHNTFNVDLYLECVRLGKTGELVFLPGIEVNVVGSNGVIANLIYIFSEELSKEKLIQIREITKEIPKAGISIKKANKIFEDFETLRIPHIGKSDHFKWSDLNQLKYDAFEVTNLKNVNYLSVIKKGFVSSVVSFSDTHIWNNYPQQKALITEIDLKNASFKDLKEKFKKNEIYSKEVL